MVSQLFRFWNVFIERDIKLKSTDIDLTYVSNSVSLEMEGRSRIWNHKSSQCVQIGTANTG